jgi:membrane protein YqaA with SNARE-associated domain
MMTIQKKILITLLRRKVLTRRETCWLLKAERHYRQRFNGERDDEFTIPRAVNRSIKLLFLLAVLRLLIEEPFLTSLGFVAMPFAIYVFLLTICKWLYRLFA